jgi:hypothetical protein
MLVLFQLLRGLSARLWGRPHLHRQGRGVPPGAFFASGHALGLGGREHVDGLLHP